MLLVFEKFTRAYLFQIALEICDYLYKVLCSSAVEELMKPPDDFSKESKRSNKTKKISQLISPT